MTQNANQAINSVIAQLATIKSATGRTFPGPDGLACGELTLTTESGPIVLTLSQFDKIYVGMVKCWPTIKPLKEEVVIENKSAIKEQILAKKADVLAAKVKARDEAKKARDDAKAAKEQAKADKAQALKAAKEAKAKIDADAKALKAKTTADAKAAKAKLEADAKAAKAKVVPMPKPATPASAPAKAKVNTPVKQPATIGAKARK